MSILYLIEEHVQYREGALDIQERDEFDRLLKKFQCGSRFACVDEEIELKFQIDAGNPDVKIDQFSCCLKDPSQCLYQTQEEAMVQCICPIRKFIRSHMEHWA